MFKTNKSTFILSFLIIILLISMIFPFSTEAKAFNAKVVLEIDWDQEDITAPIVPRYEVKELNITIKLKVVTDDYFGKGILIGYFELGKVALIDITVNESSPWCHAVLKRTRYEMNISSFDEVKDQMYLLVNDNAPGFGDGFVKLKVECPYGSVGAALEGFISEFELHFTPSYLPIIQTDLPDFNTKRVSPMEEAVFPIEIENLGNARTQVKFEIEKIPEGWEAAISDELILEGMDGSKSITYLTVIPPRDFGFHYESANIRIKMVPVMVDNPDVTGDPLYATFTVQNRGTSTVGFEQIFFYGLIVLIIIIVVYFLLKVKRKKQEENLS